MRKKKKELLNFEQRLYCLQVHYWTMLRGLTKSAKNAEKRWNIEQVKEADKINFWPKRLNTKERGVYSTQ